MINLESTNMGKVIRILREGKGMTRGELSETVGISDSHLKKIEAGTRQPGIGTYNKIMEVLEAEVAVKNEARTVKGECVLKAQRILMDCTETQALYLVDVLEFMAQTLGTLGK